MTIKNLVDTNLKNKKILNHIAYKIYNFDIIVN